MQGKLKLSELQILSLEAQKQNLEIDFYEDKSILDCVLSIKVHTNIFTVKGSYPGLRFNGFECSVIPSESESEEIKRRLTWPFRNKGQGGGIYNLSLRERNGNPFYDLKEQKVKSPKEILGLIVDLSNYRRY